MSSSIHTALHHRSTIPSWVVAVLVAAVVAIGVVAIFAGSDNSTLTPAKAASPAPTMPTSCVDSTVVGHC
jgi:hypothetical protein